MPKVRTIIMLIFRFLKTFSIQLKKNTLISIQIANNTILSNFQSNIKFMLI